MSGGLKLNIANSRIRPSTCSLVRIDQTCFGRSGGLAPTNLPLFQAPRRAELSKTSSWSCMVVLLGLRDDHDDRHNILKVRQLSDRSGGKAANPCRTLREQMTRFGHWSGWP